VATILTQAGPDFIPIRKLNKEGETFDKRKSESEVVGQYYSDMVDPLFQHMFETYGAKIFGCANVLEYTREPDEEGVLRFVFARAWFCKVRFCPMCQWRRQKGWQRRFIQAKPAIEADFKDCAFLFLTLTVRNCDNGELRNTINAMNNGFRKLTKRKDWPAIGWVKAIEVTRPKAIHQSHPHIHAVLMVRNSYFSGKRFIKQSTWARYWQEVMCLDYEPVVDIRRVKARPEEEKSVFDVAMLEVLKYSVKPDDTTSSQTWLQEITPQLLKSRWVAIGGVLRQYLRDDEPLPDEANNEAAKGGFFANYDHKKRSYKLNPVEKD
jgi:plasmid rolling circle replication initiator protein Rep